MAPRWNAGIFFVIGIGSLVLAGASVIGCIVLQCLGKADSGSTIFLLCVIMPFFGEIGCLGVWQYRKVRALNKKLDNLEEIFGQREELPAK